MTLAVFRICCVLALAACIAGSASAQSGSKDIGDRKTTRRASSISVEDELKLGEILSRQFEQEVQLSSDPAALALVDRVAQRIARNSDAYLPITVRLIDTHEINVATLPGGHIYVTLGLLRTVSSEAELASALAHGVARVTAGPLMGMELSTFLPATLSQNLFLAGGISGPAAQNGLPIQIKVFAASQEAVREADSLGLQYLYASGYDPRLAVDLLQKIEALSPAARDLQQGPVYDPSLPQPAGKLEKIPAAVRRHPTIPQRIKKIQVATRSLPPRDSNIVTTAEFEEVRRSIQ